VSCQRCLQPLPLDLAVETRLRFADGEAEAERLDESSEEDVLALPASLDLRELLEDVLILALPLVPRHEACTMRAAAGFAADEAYEPPAADNPFAVLARLRHPAGGGQDA
jgi:uncharacterized protein